MSGYLTIYQLAERLNVAVSTIYVWRERGWIVPPVKLGHRVYWLEKTINEWEAAGFPRPCDSEESNVSNAAN